MLLPSVIDLQLLFLSQGEAKVVAAMDGGGITRSTAATSSSHCRPTDAGLYGGFAE